MHPIRRHFLEFFAQFLPPCDVITRRLSDLRHRRLSLKERVTLRLHLLFCSWCTHYGKQIDIVDKAIMQQTGATEEMHQLHRRLSNAARLRIAGMLKSESD
jgi:hypothetical protein